MKLCRICEFYFLVERDTSIDKVGFDYIKWSPFDSLPNILNNVKIYCLPILKSLRNVIGFLSHVSNL